MKRILVTGGFGFLGTHLVEELLRADPDVHVHVVDNLCTSPLGAEEFLEEIGSPPRLTYTIASVEEFLKDPGTPPFQEIYHLASAVGPAGVLQHAGQMIRSIVSDTYLVMEAARCWKARLVDVSTSEVYNGGRDGYCSEELPKIVPAVTTVRLEYAVGKLAAEMALINTCRVTDLHASIIRPFNIAGPRQSGKGGFVLPRFIEQALEGNPLTVFGTGKQVRAFTHVKDTALGLRLAMGRGKPGEAYNIGNPKNRITILHLAQRVVALTGSKSEIRLVEPKTIYGPLYAEANDKFPEDRKARQELGWQAERGVDAVICDALEYTRQRRAGKKPFCPVPSPSPASVTVSICMPTFNRQQLLPATLKTVFSQTLQDFELLLCDDGSTDGTLGYLSKLRDPRVHILSNPVNLGLPQTLNRLFSMARGKYVAILHDHDLFHPHLLEKSVHLLEQNPDASFAFCGVTWINEREEDIATFIPFQEGRIPRELLHKILLFRLDCPVAMSSTVIRKSSLHRTGYFEPSHGIQGDLDLWIRLSRENAAVFAGEPLVRVRTRTRREEEISGGWKALQRCQRMRLDSFRRFYLGQPIRKTAGIARIRFLYLWAETVEGLYLWSRGQRQILLSWAQELRSRPFHPLRLFIPLLICSTSAGRTFGGLRRRILGRS